MTFGQTEPNHTVTAELKEAKKLQRAAELTPFTFDTILLLKMLINAAFKETFYSLAARERMQSVTLTCCVFVCTGAVPVPLQSHAQPGQ